MPRYRSQATMKSFQARQSVSCSCQAKCSKVRNKASSQDVGFGPPASASLTAETWQCKLDSRNFTSPALCTF